MKIKVCGITESEDFKLIADSGVIDYAGFILYRKSPRYISPESVRDITSHHRGGLKIVGVAVNPTKEEIKNYIETAGVDILQLHGDESPEFCDSLNIEYWKAFRFREINEISIVSDYSCDTVLIDSFSASAYGGTGIKADKEILSRAGKLNRNTFIAGGIESSDLHSLKTMGFYGADLNSSLEISPGKKNLSKLKELFRVAEKLNEK